MNKSCIKLDNKALARRLELSQPPIILHACNVSCVNEWHILRQNFFSLTVCLTKRVSHAKISFQNHPNRTIILILLLVGGQVSPNPGPPRYSCGLCSKTVRSNQRALACDECNVWYHTNCVDIGNSTYSQLQVENAFWFCESCGLPNYSSSLFTSLNSFSVLSIDKHDESLDSNSTEIQVGDQISHSSPNVPVKKNKSD